MSKNLELNAMSEKELENIQGLSKDHVRKIVDYRKQYGPFNSWEDLKHIPGISGDILDALRRHGVKVEGKAA
jgi:competence ComEA-like helix-hairpin-helix protein